MKTLAKRKTPTANGSSRDDEASLRLRKAQTTQTNPAWLRELRSQYTEDVSRRTLEINEAFPALKG